MDEVLSDSQKYMLALNKCIYQNTRKTPVQNHFHYWIYTHPIYQWKHKTCSRVQKAIFLNEIDNFFIKFKRKCTQCVPYYMQKRCPEKGLCFHCFHDVYSCFHISLFLQTCDCHFNKQLFTPMKKLWGSCGNRV